VLVVSAGAGAGAMAACVAQGALALFNLDRLADALRSLDGFSVEETRQVSELGFPDRFRSLLGLTAGERRVLFYLTEGWAAQDVADELVVSLTTVRSHIRSVLRKLGVRSQLAAVAIANSRDLEHHKVTANS
jgi:DNA-binding NarL/FixJ family response regulator